MFELVETETFSAWLGGPRDLNAQLRIQRHLARLAFGNPGDVKPVGEGVSEMRIDYGPGYRVYCTRHGQKVIILLAGGDKRTQSRDIAAALGLAQSIRKMK